MLDILGHIEGDVLVCNGSIQTLIIISKQLFYPLHYHLIFEQKFDVGLGEKRVEVFVGINKLSCCLLDFLQLFLKVVLSMSALGGREETSLTRMTRKEILLTNQQWDYSCVDTALYQGLSL